MHLQENQTDDVLKGQQGMRLGECCFTITAIVAWTALTILASQGKGPKSGLGRVTADDDYSARRLRVEELEIVDDRGHVMASLGRNSHESGNGVALRLFDSLGNCTA